MKTAEEHDVVVIGAGPAGAVGSALLVREGLRVLVLEREQFPRFVIGESLLPKCNELLREAGMLEAVEREGFLEKHGALFLRGEERCRFDFSEQFTPGAAYTWQVPRDRFDEVLIGEARRQGADVRFGHEVTAVEVGERPRVRVRGGSAGERWIGCRFVFDASGYGRVLPRLLGLERPSELPPRRAVFTHFEGDERPQGTEEGLIWIVQLKEARWAWVIPFSNGRTSYGVVGPKEAMDRGAADPLAVLTSAIDEDPHCRRRLAKVRPVFAPRRIDGYSVAVEKLFGPGFCLTGNATEFLDPIFSSGVTLALESARLAARAAARQLAGEQVDWREEYVRPFMRGVDCFREYVGAWYSGRLQHLFFRARPPAASKRMICSVLAGHAWDESNPVVREPARKIDQLNRLSAGPAPGN